MVSLGLLAEKSIFRTGLVQILKLQGFNVQETETLEEWWGSDGRELPELLLVSLGLATVADVVGLMSTIRAQAPLTKVIFLLTELDMGVLRGCFAAGAAGYLLKSISPEALEKSLLLVVAGEKVFPSALASQLNDPAGQPLCHQSVAIQCCELSDREKKILAFLVSGLSNKVIAANLNIAESTTKLYISSLLRKLHASNRTQAALRAVQYGLVAPNPLL